LRHRLAQLADRPALESDLLWRADHDFFTLAMAAPQVAQQLHLFVFADVVLGTRLFQACILQLSEQTLDGYAYDTGELFYRDFTHLGVSWSTSSALHPQTRAPGQS
jgi:hypothetical protein